MDTSQYVGQASELWTVWTVSTDTSAVGCWYTEHGLDTGEARTLEQLVDGESESAVLLLHHDRNHCTCSWSHWHFNCTVVHYYIYLLLSEMLPTEWQTLSAVHCTVDKLKILCHLYKAMLRSWSLWYDIATKQNLEINIWIVSCNCQRCLDIQYLKSVKYLWST